MNAALRTIARKINPCLLRTVDTYQSSKMMPVFSRALWHMSRTSNVSYSNSLGNVCSCGCRGLSHTNGERELVNFLKEEIAAEQKALKIKNLPREIDGFVLKGEGAEITLTKSADGETISISMNVNHSVDADVEPEVDPKADNPDLELKSKPNFDVSIVRGDKTLSFCCSFTSLEGGEADDGFNDSFSIDEVTYFEGERKENTYSVSGDVLDGNLYDLFMTVLEEKGVSSEFADKLSDIATAYEHQSYITLLGKLAQFASPK